MGQNLPDISAEIEKIAAKPRILASATVDMVKTGPMPTWDVSVWGREPFDHRRNYTIKRKTDTEAAQEGIRQFVEEMENLWEAQNEE